MLRAAAKNHNRTVVVSDPEDYHDFAKELQAGSISQATRERFALKAFEMTADYDESIASYFRKTNAVPEKQVSALDIDYISPPQQADRYSFH